MNRSAASPTALPSIASLLPSASEICVALGLGDRLVGRSHECDFPAHLKDLPVLTGATVDSQASSREIDRQVRAQLTEGLSLYRVEEERLQELRPIWWSPRTPATYAQYRSPRSRKAFDACWDLMLKSFPCRPRPWTT